MSTHWIHIGNIQDIPRLGARIVNTQNGDIAVFRTANNQIFALRDRCPHRGGPLSQGIVHDETVTCPLHNWRINLALGQAQAPDEGCVPTFAVQVAANGDISLNLEQLEQRVINSRESCAV